MKRGRNFWGKFTALICISVLLTSFLAGFCGKAPAQGARGNATAEGGRVQGRSGGASAEDSTRTAAQLRLWEKS